MDKIDWKTKLSSRKFWALLASFIAGVVVLVTGNDPTTTVGGCVMAFGAVVAYILGESWVDAANAGSSTTAVNVTTTSKETADKMLGTGE